VLKLFPTRYDGLRARKQHSPAHIVRATRWKFWGNSKMELKHDIAAITNSYISQLHYVVSRLVSTKEKNFPQEWAELLEITSKFEKRIKHEHKRAK
jgi:hypothetical protein